MAIGYIYLIENIVDGKKYVGLTRKTLKERWNGHVYVASTKPRSYLHRAMHKYGVDNFSFTWFASSVSLTALADLEKQVIRQVKPEYNQTNGGELTIGKKHTPEVIARISANNTGKKRTEKQKQRQSEIKKQRLAEDPGLKEKWTQRLALGNNPDSKKKRALKMAVVMKGKKMSDEARAKLSASCMGRKYSREIIDRMAASKRKAVRCVETGVIYSCAEEAGKALGIYKTNINRACKKPNARARGFHFQYVGD